MSSYVVAQKDVEKFLSLPSMNDQEGISFAYATDPDALAKLIPAPLKLVAPIICGYVVHMGRPSFGAPYLEQTLFALVSYKDKLVGSYPLTLLLHGPGAEAGLVAGREGASIPKKLADRITLRRNDQTATATVARHGKTLLTVAWEAGDVNDPEILKTFGSQFALNQESIMNSFFFDYQLVQDEQGANHFSNVALLATQMKSLADRVEPGKLTIKLDSTEDDPFGELPVLKPLGAMWYHFATSTMFKTLRFEEVNANKTAPYLITGRYDRSMMNPFATTYTI